MHEVAGLVEATERLICGAEGVIYFYNVALRSSYERIHTLHYEIQDIKAASTSSASDPATSSAASPPTFQRILVGVVLIGTERQSLLKKGLIWREDWDAISLRSQKILKPLWKICFVGLYGCVAKQGKQKAVLWGILGGTGEVVLAGDTKWLRLVGEYFSASLQSFVNNHKSIFGYLGDLCFSLVILLAIDYFMPL